jgi:hypothetical protein
MHFRNKTLLSFALLVFFFVFLQLTTHARNENKRLEALDPVRCRYSLA